MPNARRLALAMTVSAALAGCGSSSPPSGSNAERLGAGLAAIGSPVHGAADAPGSYIVKSSDPIRRTKRAPAVARYPAEGGNNEVSAPEAVPFRPCDLVSREEASAILAEPVRATQEPRGPTCVYAMRESDQLVTLVVESTRLASLRAHARKASRVRVAGRSGWCLRYESTSIAVPLTGGRVLHVTGPCPAATRFAARALPRIAQR